MAAYEDTFDARWWVKEHGAPSHGLRLVLHLTAKDLDSTLQLPSCASWEIPELGAGGSRSEGFRGTLGSLLEKAHRDVERNRGHYGEAAAQGFDDVLGRIRRALRGELGEAAALRLCIRDPSGLVAVAEELSGSIAERAAFARSEAESGELGLELAPPPGRQLASAAEVAELVRQARRVVALTGAGISVESGVTPFRNPSNDDKGSIWGTFDAAKMTVQNFNTDPEIAEAWWHMKRTLVAEAEHAAPNPAHKFFRMLEDQGKLEAVVTQNIDSLHLKAGISSAKNIEVHGHMRGLICSNKRTPLNLMPCGDGECTFAIPADDSDALRAAYDEVSTVPICPLCGCALRTETVMFGQTMPESAVEAAMDAIDRADLLLVIGSTLIVQPVNEFPALALRSGTPLVIINLDNTRYDPYATGLVREKAGVFLSEVANELQQMPQPSVPVTAAPPAKTAASRKPTPEEVKELKVTKEGRKCGKEILACGAPFYCTAVAEPEGDIKLLDQCLAAMNRECPGAGKMLFSDGTEKLAVVAHLPDAHVGQVHCGQWLEHVASSIGGEVTESSDAYGRLVVVADVRKDVYPIKLKDPGIMAAIGFLKEKGLIPAEEDGADDFIYGDHDYPMG